MITWYVVMSIGKHHWGWFTGKHCLKKTFFVAVSERSVVKGGLTLLDKVACIFGVRLLPCFATLTGNELVAHLNPQGVPDFSGGRDEMWRSQGIESLWNDWTNWWRAALGLSKRSTVMFTRKVSLIDWSHQDSLEIVTWKSSWNLQISRSVVGRLTVVLIQGRNFQFPAFKLFRTT